LNGHQRPIYKWFGIRKFFRVLLVQKVLSSQKIQSVLSSKVPWPKHLGFNKELFECFIVQSISFERDFSSLLLTQGKWLRGRGSLVVKRSEHKGRIVLVWFRTCKGFLQDSGTLKRVAWGLDIGTRVWPNQYKTEFALFLPLNSFIYCYLSFALRKFSLNWIIVIHNKGTLILSLKKNKILIGEIVCDILIQSLLLKISEATCLTVISYHIMLSHLINTRKMVYKESLSSYNRYDIIHNHLIVLTFINLSVRVFVVVSFHHIWLRDHFKGTNPSTFNFKAHERHVLRSFWLVRNIDFVCGDDLL